MPCLSSQSFVRSYDWIFTENWIVRLVRRQAVAGWYPNNNWAWMRWHRIQQRLILLVCWIIWSWWFFNAIPADIPASYQWRAVVQTWLYQSDHRTYVSLHFFLFTTVMILKPVVIICSGSGKTSILMALLGVSGWCFDNPIIVNDLPIYRRDALHSINCWCLVQPSQKGRRGIRCSRIMGSEWNNTQ